MGKIRLVILMHRPMIKFCGFQLWVILQLDDYEKGTAFNVSYMEWNDFKETVLHPNDHCEKWNMLVGMDCVIGGIDYSIDHRRVAQSCEAILSNLSCFQEARKRVWPVWRRICNLRTERRFIGPPGADVASNQTGTMCRTQNRHPSTFEGHCEHAKPILPSDNNIEGGRRNTR